MSPFEKLQRAAALKYSGESDEAPVVVASGMGSAARKIVGLAEKSGVPVFRDDSLATLLVKLNAGTQIPPELYQAVVDIYVYFLKFRVDENGRVIHDEKNAPEEKTLP